MAYCVLTDDINRDEVIKREGRKAYRFSYGPDRWVRSGIMAAFLNPDSDEYGKYEPISDQEALDRVERRGRQAREMLDAATGLFRAAYKEESDAAKGRIDQAAAALEDLEKKTVCFLQEALERHLMTKEDIQEEPSFTPRVKHSILLVNWWDDVSEEEYLRSIKRDLNARYAKMEYCKAALSMGEIPEADRARLKRWLAFLEG